MCIRDSSYRDGRREGTWTFWHRSGEEWLLGRYEGGRRAGPWLAGTPEGELEPEETGLYADGERVRALGPDELEALAPR